MSYQAKKCANDECSRDAYPHRNYCSSSCAPYGPRVAKATVSVPIVKSTIRVAGDPSEEFSPEESSIDSEPRRGTLTQALELTRTLNEERATGRTTSENLNEVEPTTGDSPQNEESSGLSPDANAPSEIPSGFPSSRNIESAETRLLAFIAPLPSSDKEKFQPKNYIDISLQYLHDLMKDVAASEPERRASPVMINSVCNLAKNMRELLKLKLDIYQAARGDE